MILEGRRALVAALAVALILTAAVARAQPEPCSAEASYSLLERWVGEWQVVDGTGGVVASSQVRARLQGCVFEEVRQRVDGSEELAIIFLDRASGGWVQHWMSSRGDSGRFELSFEGDEIGVEGSVSTSDGLAIPVRARVTPRAEGGFVQVLELSLDGGATWGETQTALLLPADEVVAPSRPVAPALPAPAVEAPAAEAPAAEPTVAPVPAPSSVKLRSQRKADAAVPMTEMESPMTLEFELGPLADLPAGAAWRTDELEPYVADGVNIPLVTAQRRERRGRTELELVVNLHLVGGQAKVDLDVALVVGGSVVAGERSEGIALGKLIRSHDPKTGLPHTVRIELDDGTFGELFAGGERPSVRLTLAVR